MKTHNNNRWSLLVYFVILSAIWFGIGWLSRGWYMGPEIRLIEQAYRTLRSNEALDLPTPRQMTYAAIRGILQSVSADTHSALLPPPVSQRFWNDFSGQSGIVGVTAQKQNNDIVVVQVTSGGPADRAGIKPGDVILSVDGVVFDKDTSEAEASLLIRGPVDSPAHFTILRGDALLEFSPIRQERIVTSSKMLDNGVAYLAQYRFTTNAPEIVYNDLQTLLASNPAGLIWDLRNNSGGSMETAQEILSYFFDDGDLFLTELIGGKQKTFSVIEGKNVTDIPIVLLIDQTTYSAAETSAATIKERQRGVLIGSTSFGKGTVQTTIPLSENCLLQFTVAKWLSPSGQWYEGQGVSPDIFILDDPSTPQDELIEFASDYLLQTDQP